MTHRKPYENICKLLWSISAGAREKTEKRSFAFFKNRYGKQLAVPIMLLYLAVLLFNVAESFSKKVFETTVVVLVGKGHYSK